MDTAILLQEGINKESQIWRIIKIGNSYTFLNLASKEYLNFQNIEKGALVITKSTSEKFCLEKQLNKYYLKPEGIPELCMQIQGNSNEDFHLELSTTSLSDSNAFVFETYNTSNINDYVVKTEIKIIPNPVNDKFKVILPETIEGYCNVIILNHLGQELKNLTIGNSDQIIDISDLTPGVYIVKIETERINTTVKLIKSRNLFY